MRRGILLLVMLGGIVALAACQPFSSPSPSLTSQNHKIDASLLRNPNTAAWSMFGGDPAHTGYATSSPSHSIAGRVLWSQKIGPVFSSSVAGLGMVYVASTNGYLSAFKQDTGAAVWRVNIGSHLTDATPALEGSVLFVAVRSTTLEAFNALTGQLYWSFNASEKIQAPPLVAGEHVFLASLTTLWSIAATDGHLLWKFHQGSAGWPTTGSPTLVGDMVVFGLGTGSQIWALDATSGRTKWAFDTGDRITSTVVNGDDMLYGATWHGAVFALDRATGKKRWSYLLNPQHYQSVVDGVAGSMALADGHLYFGDYRGRVVCMDAVRGKVLWSYSTGAQVVATPIVASSQVYIGSGDGYFYALNTRTGRPAWHVHTGEVRSAASLVNDHLYIGSIDGMLYAFF